MKSTPDHNFIPPTRGKNPIPPVQIFFDKNSLFQLLITLDISISEYHPRDITPTEVCFQHCFLLLRFAASTSFRANEKRSYKRKPLLRAGTFCWASHSSDPVAFHSPTKNNEPKPNPALHACCLLTACNGQHCTHQKAEDLLRQGSHRKQIRDPTRSAEALDSLTQVLSDSISTSTDRIPVSLFIDQHNLTFNLLLGFLHIFCARSFARWFRFSVTQAVARVMCTRVSRHRHVGVNRSGTCSNRLWITNRSTWNPPPNPVDLNAYKLPQLLKPRSDGCHFVLFQLDEKRQWKLAQNGHHEGNCVQSSPCCDVALEDKLDSERLLVFRCAWGQVWKTCRKTMRRWQCTRRTSAVLYAYVVTCMELTPRERTVARTCPIRAFSRSSVGFNAALGSQLCMTDRWWINHDAIKRLLRDRGSTNFSPFATLNQFNDNTEENGEQIPRDESGTSAIKHVQKAWKSDLIHREILAKRSLKPVKWVNFAHDNERQQSEWKEGTRWFCRWRRHLPLKVIPEEPIDQICQQLRLEPRRQISNSQTKIDRNHYEAPDNVQDATKRARWSFSTCTWLYQTAVHVPLVRRRQQETVEGMSLYSLHSYLQLRDNPGKLFPAPCCQLVKLYLRHSLPNLPEFGIHHCRRHHFFAFFKVRLTLLQDPVWSMV